MDEWVSVLLAVAEKMHMSRSLQKVQSRGIRNLSSSPLLGEMGTQLCGTLRSMISLACESSLPTTLEREQGEKNARLGKEVPYSDKIPASPRYEDCRQSMELKWRECLLRCGRCAILSLKATPGSGMCNVAAFLKDQCY